MSARPNVLFFFTDDQRFDTIAALGCSDIQTPHIDSLVRSGVAFTHAHIPCGTSGAVCMPSRAMLITGRSLFHIHEAGQEIPPEHATMGEAFREAGYRTFGTGKWHNGRESYHRSFTDGDEVFFGGMADHWNVPAYHFDPTGRYDAVRGEIKSPQTSNEVVSRPCDHVTAGLHSSQMVADAALNFLDGLSSSEPFYAYLSFLAPHDPRSMPERFLRMYDPEGIDLPDNFMGGHPFNTGALHIRDEMLASFPRDPDETRRHIAEYYAMISHLDHEIGRVLDLLGRKGMMENTIIVFAGDNGLALGQHGLFGKQNCYDHSVRVPLIFSGPGLPRDERRDSLVYLSDIFPTLCEMCGIPIPDSVEGKSLCQSISSREAAVRECLYFAYCEFQRAVRYKNHKLIEYVDDGRRHATQLFDLLQDPRELHNLAENPDYAGLLAEMREKLAECRDDWGDRESKWGKRFWRDYEAGG